MIAYNVSLQAYNTFGIDVLAKQFACFNSVTQLQQLLPVAEPLLVLGGGSNILFTKNFDGLVLRNEVAGIELVTQDADYVYVKAGAGQNWHQLVLYCIAQGWAGLENLALIPGNVGASPMQNIGAYGVEIKDVFHQLEAWHIQDKALVSFDADACQFGYRESVFKRHYKAQFIITTVTYRLRKQPVFTTTYGAIQQQLDAMGVQELSSKAIADAVIAIRSSKLPNPAVLGNAGSFFKNPVVTAEKFAQLKINEPGIVGYAQGDGQVKLAAGWLIEQCGWRGKQLGRSGCHQQQALVLVNIGGAVGTEIYGLSEAILQDVQNRFGVLLEREVNIV